MAARKRTSRSDATASRRRNKAARTGAAAFAVGLFLAGPQAAGVATADTDSTDSGPASTATDNPTGPTRSSKATSGRSGRAATTGAARPARDGAGTPRPSASAATPRGAATVKTVQPPTDNSASAPSLQSAAPSARAEATSIRLRPAAPIAPAVIAAAATASSQGAPATAAQASSAAVTDAANPAAAVTAPPIARSGRLAAADSVNEAGVKLLDTVANWLAMLPNQKISDLFAGALLRVRRDLFDQAPTASPVQETTTSEGLIIGTVGAIDPEDDPLTYTVITNPQFGTVALTEDGHYTYTPGSDYAGTDAFTVKITDNDGRRNLLTPGPDGSLDVQIIVGAGASDDPFIANNLNDAALLLKNTAATISVERKMGGLLGSIALDIPDDTPLLWLDEQGRTGTISAAEVAQHWDGIQNAGNVTLGIDYTLDDGTEATMILRSVQATYTDTGQYVFSGLLAPVARDGEGVNSFWDVVGNEYKASYENFRQQAGIEAFGFRSFAQDIAGASVYLDTFSVHDYEQALLGKDLGTPVNEPGASPSGAAGLKSLVASSTAVVAEGVKVTAMLPYGSSLIVGQSDGSVEQWNGQNFMQMQKPGPSPVKTLIPYQSGFIVGQENGAIRQWDGTQWKELLSADTLTEQSGGTWTPETKKLSAVLAYGSGFVIGTQQGEVKQWTGTEWKDLSGRDIYGAGAPAYGTGTIGAMAPYTVRGWNGLYNGVAIPEGFVIGVADGVDAGAVRFWNGTGWQELQGPTGVGISALTPLTSTSFVAARSNGAVELWDLDEAKWNSVSGAKSGGVEWFSWTQLSGPGSPVTTMLKDPLGKLEIGRADGSVQRRDYADDCYTNCRLELKTVLGKGNTLAAGQKLNLGESLVSLNGGYALTLQQDGNLVLSGTTKGAQAIWASGTYGKNVDRAELQADGNFVLYAGTTAVWNTGTSGKQNVRLIVQDDRNVVAYSDGNSVWVSNTQSFDAAPPAGRAVTSMLGYGDEFVASFADGSVKRGRVDFGSGQPKFGWIDMSPAGTAGVTAMAPYSVPPSTDGADGFYVGLDNGVIKRYAKWPNRWTDMRALPEPGYFNGAVLEKAVTFAQAKGQITSVNDPLFGVNGLTSYQPLCLSNNNCGSGTIYTFNISKAPAALASKSISFAGANQSAEIAYDLGTTGYGYVFVPGGVWDKLDTSQYSFGVLLAVTTGPSLTLNLGNGCEENTCKLNAAETQLASLSWSTPPSPYGNVTLTGDVSAKLDVVLGMPEGFTKNKLNAHAYLTGGVALAYNTPAAYWNGGWNYYYDADVSDFTNLTSVSLIPTLTPTVTGTWGYTVPNVPILGTVSLASIGLTYSNPVDLNLTLAKGSAPSLTLGSSGTLEFKAGFVPELTGKLTYSTTYPLYSVRTGNLLTA